MLFKVKNQNYSEALVFFNKKNKKLAELLLILQSSLSSKNPEAELSRYFTLRHEKAHFDNLHAAERMVLMESLDLSKIPEEDGLKFLRLQEKEADFCALCSDKKSSQGAIEFFEKLIKSGNLAGKGTTHPRNYKRLEWSTKINRLQNIMENL